MKNHKLWMVIGCGLPLLLIFFAPALGITGYNEIFAFVILMFVLHLFMPMHGGGHRQGHQDQAGHNDKGRQGKKESAVEAKDGHKVHNHH